MHRCGPALQRCWSGCERCGAALPAQLPGAALSPRHRGRPSRAAARRRPASGLSLQGGQQGRRRAAALGESKARALLVPAPAAAARKEVPRRRLSLGDQKELRGRRAGCCAAPPAERRLRLSEVPAFCICTWGDSATCYTKIVLLLLKSNRLPPDPSLLIHKRVLCTCLGSTVHKNTVMPGLLAQQATHTQLTRSLPQLRRPCSAKGDLAGAAGRRQHARGGPVSDEVAHVLACSRCREGSRLGAGMRQARWVQHGSSPDAQHSSCPHGHVMHKPSCPRAAPRPAHPRAGCSCCS